MDVSFIKSINFERFLNIIKILSSYNISKIIHRPVIWGLPSVVSIEPTNLCNLKCPECPSGTGKLTRPLGLMKLDSFKNIIDQVKDKSFYVQLFLQGEPYINKELPEMIRYAHDNKMYISVSTNGLLINKNNITKLLENAPNKLIFSMDGADEETYRMYRVGGDFNKALENLRLLIEEKRKLNLSKPYIELQFLVMKQNEQQIKQIQETAKNIGVDQLTLKTMQVYSYESAVTFLPENKKYSRYEIKEGRLVIKNKLKNRCLALWRTAVITWDLRLVPCCFDKDAKYELGSLNDSTLNETWKSEKYQAFRQQILINRKSIDICTNCTEGMTDNI